MDATNQVRENRLSRPVVTEGVEEAPFPRQGGTEPGIIASSAAWTHLPGAIPGSPLHAEGPGGARLSVEWLRENLKYAEDLGSAFDAHAVIATSDARGRILHVNSKFSALSGYAPAELIGRDHRIVKSDHHPREFFRDLWATISQGGIWQGEIKNRAKDGSPFWLAMTIVPMLDDEGRPWQFVSLGADISKQKRVEAELAAKLRLQQLLADLSARFVAAQSDQIDAAIEDTQRRIVETLGLDRSTLWQIAPGGTELLLTHCWQRPGWPLIPTRFQTSGSIPWAADRIITGEGYFFKSIDDLPPEAALDAATFRQYGTKSNVVVPLTSNGRVFGALAFACLASEREWEPDEITDLKLVAQIIANVLSRQRAEERLEQLRHEIGHGTRVAMLGELTTTLAHELSQPLTAILTNAQSALRFMPAGSDEEPDDIREILQDIIRDDKRATGVLQNLRAMLSGAPVVRESWNLNDLVREVAEFLHSEFIFRDILLTQELAPGLPNVRVARVEIQQVLVNLLLNAAQAMADTPAQERVIIIQTCATDQQVVASVRDRGHGIPPGQLEQIFEPFHSTKASGLGMGLAICRRMMDAHQGSIVARNHPDGAEFVITLPADTAADMPAEAPAPAPGRQAFSPE